MNDAEKRAYANGYNAGRRKEKRDMTARNVRRERAAFWNRVFLVILPACAEGENWTEGEKGEPITTLPARTRLAADFADEAMKYWRYEL